MNETTRSLKAQTALNQIATLRTQRDLIAASWLARGAERTQEMCEAIGEQIVALYEEIDAIESGETSQAGRTENRVGREDEATLEECRTMARLGWSLKQLRKHQRKATARLAG